jgi:ABC-2 type transport system ATP-binding protein
MWQLVRQLRDTGVTIILTTHYIEEAEDMADRVGVMRKGRIILVEEKQALMQKLGKKRLTLQLQQPLAHVPQVLAPYALELSADGSQLSYSYDARSKELNMVALMQQLAQAGVAFKDLQTTQSSLEDIFVSLVHEPEPEPA